MKAKALDKLHLKFLVRSIFVLTIGVVIFETMTFYQMSQMVRELTVKNMQSSVERAAVKIDDELSKLKTDLDIISNLPALEDYYLNLQFGLINEANQHKNSLIAFFQKQSTRNNAYLLFKICTPNLKPLASYSINQKLTSLVGSTSCVANKQIYQQRFKKSPKSLNKSYLIANHQVTRGKNILGSVEIYFDINQYFEMVNEYPLFESGFLGVISPAGALLSTNDKLRQEIQQKSYDLIQKNRNTAHITISIGDEPQNLVTYQTHLNSLDWRVQAFVTESEIFAPLYAQIKLAILLIVGMIITEIFLLSFFTQRLITHRINRLLIATQSILKGNYQQYLSEKGNDEITALSRSFNEMSVSLQTELNNLDIERRELSKSKQLLQAIIDNSTAIISIKNVDGEYLMVNHAYEKHMKHSNESIIGKTDYELHTADKAEVYRKNDKLVVETEAPLHFEEESISAEGQTKTFISVKFPLKDQDNKVYATCGIATDITDRKNEEKALQKLNAKLSLSNAVLENIIEGIVITDGKFNIIDLNPALVTLFGYSRLELIGNKPSIFRSEVHQQSFFDELYSTLETKGSWHGEIWEKTKSGEITPQLLTVTSLRDEKGDITHYAGIYSDITDLKATEAKLQKLAHFDSLTGLANRLLLEERTTQAILMAQRGGHKVTMLFIDLDNFKYINDTLGHDIGDKLLKKVSKRFHALLRESDTLARQGGDEFVILLTQTTHADDAQIIANKVRAAGSKPFYVDDNELFISTSIGIAVYPDDALSTSELFKCADMAMYAAKDSGKNSFQFFSEKLNHAAVDRLKTERALRQAIIDNQLQLYYQPQINVVDDKIVKAEALLRWPQSDGSFIPPDLFVPIAEESGLIVSLGEWVVKQAVLDLKKIHQRGKNLKISINLSARQFRHHALANQLYNIIKNAKFDPRYFEFEVTESLLVDDFKLAKTILNEIKEFGFTIALDDFGKGYSSLSYLKLFPIDTLKLDRSFMKDLTEDMRTQAIVKAATELGQALGMQIVYEGVETKAQYNFAKAIGNIDVQGYYCAKPLRLEEFIELVSDKKTKNPA